MAVALLAVGLLTAATGCAELHVTRTISLDEAREAAQADFEQTPAATKSALCGQVQAGSLRTPEAAQKAADMYEQFHQRALSDDMVLGFDEAQYALMTFTVLEEGCAAL